MSIRWDYYSNGLLKTLNQYGIVANFAYHPNGNLWKRQWIKDGQPVEVRFETYYRGVARNEYWPNDIIISRDVNDTGTIAWEKNGRNFINYFTYDKLNRLTAIDRPAPHVDSTITWVNFRKKELRRGNYLESTAFDGFGNTLLLTQGKVSDVQARRYKNYTYDQYGRTLFESHWSSSSNETLGTSMRCI